MFINKSIFLLGAGASAASDFNLPTMAALIEDASFSRHRHLLEFATKYFPNKKPNEIDVEELITYLDFVDSKYSIFGDTPNPNIWHVKNELFVYLRQRLTEQVSKEYCEKFKRLFAGHAEEKCRDTIITVNYDLVVDKTLAALAKRNDLGELSHESLLSNMYDLIQEVIYFGGTPFSANPEPAYYLKLHGSLDWYFCPNDRCKNHLIFFANRLQTKWPRVSENEICQLCGARAELVIVPPNINKSINRFPKLAFIWNMAYQEIKAADALVIIGLSFRNTDYYLRWLVRSSLFNVGRSSRIIEVVDTNGAMREKIADLIGTKSEDIGYFETLLEYIEFVEKERKENRRA